jgi:2-polyprenyl-3-methyl-5-hydroxy-6-metoxy-1,4-benzoquinol methylase
MFLPELAEGQEFQFLTTRPDINKLLSELNHSQKRILDLGCSDNVLSIATHCLDYKVPSNLSQQVIFIEQDLNLTPKLPFPDKFFDLVYCSHVLEHLDLPWLILEEISRIGKYGIVIVPTKFEDNLFSSDPIIKKGNYLHGRYGHKWWFDYGSEATMKISKRQRMIRCTDKRDGLASIRDLMPNLFEICFIFGGRVRHQCIQDPLFEGRPHRIDNTDLPFLFKACITLWDSLWDFLSIRFFILRKKLNLRLRDRIRKLMKSRTES